MRGHVYPGLGFFLFGLWHLFNHIKHHAQKPKSFTFQPWFPTPIIRHMELLLILMGSGYYGFQEILWRHRFDPDGTIPSRYLRHFEHSSIGMTFMLYASFSVLLDVVAAKAKYGMTHLLGAVALGQQLLMFRLHSSDHGGLVGQYHLFLQIITLLSLATTLMAIGHPKSFILAFSRSVSIIFLGVWLIATGVMLWTPSLLPKGCSIALVEGHKEIRCDDESLHRAKALINIEFSWYVIAITIFSVSFYLYLVNLYGEKHKNLSWAKKEEKGEEHDDDDFGL